MKKLILILITASISIGLSTVSMAVVMNNNPLYSGGTGGTNPLYGSGSGTTPAPTGSAAVMPLNSTVVKPLYPSQISHAPLPPNGDFTQIPMCPNSPYDLKNDRINNYEFPPICPDINGNWTDGSVTQTIFNSSSQTTETTRSSAFYTSTIDSSKDVNCPKYCIVTQRVIKAGNTIKGIRRAICPDGYAQVATFNMQPEIIKTTTALNYPGPLTWADYLKYKADGSYVCTLNSNRAYYVDLNSTGGTVTDDDFCPNVKNALDANDYQTFVSRTSAGATYDENGFAGKYVKSTQRAGICFYAGDACVNFVAGEPKPEQAGCTPSDIYNVWLKYEFRYFSCTVPPNTFISTSYSAPASAVCARVQDKWSNENAPTGVTRQ